MSKSQDQTQPNLKEKTDDVGDPYGPSIPRDYPRSHPADPAASFPVIVIHHKDGSVETIGRNLNLPFQEESSKAPMTPYVPGEWKPNNKLDYQVSIDIYKHAQNMRGRLNTLKPLSGFVCIYKVPDQLRDLNEKAYTPHMVSIGPFHHGKEKLAKMEEVKIRYLQHFLSRNVILEKVFEETLKAESKLRACYAENIELGSQDFVPMMVLDGCFVLEYLLLRHSRSWEPNDPIFSQQQIMDTIRFDLLLLENQIPFFYLNNLLGLLMNNRPREGLVSMDELILHFLKRSIGWDWFAEDISEYVDFDVKHILHVMSICLFPKDLRQQGLELKIRTSPSIVELHSAGVKFKSSSNRHFLDIQFKNGILDIPTWKINDHTEVVFRNLLAFEQCNSQQHYFSDYVAFMDMLINVEEDVGLLVQNGIIEHLLQDYQSVVVLVNNLGKNNMIYSHQFYFSDLVGELKSYCERPWHKWKATLKQEYFKNPWTVISVIAAAFLLLLTILQSVCSVLQVL